MGRLHLTEEKAAAYLRAAGAPVAMILGCVTPRVVRGCNPHFIWSVEALQNQLRLARLPVPEIRPFLSPNQRSRHGFVQRREPKPKPPKVVRPPKPKRLKSHLLDVVVNDVASLDDIMP